jgi:hypothetical protein
MTLPVYHLTKDEDQRKLTKEWSERASKVFDETKKDSLSDAIAYMKDHWGSLKIHKEDWKIQEERTYPKSADPIKSEG